MGCDGLDLLKALLVFNPTERCNANVVLAERREVLVISESLVQYDGLDPFVEVQVGEAVFERRAVDLGLSDGITVELLSGVTAEESIKVWNQPQYR